MVVWRIPFSRVNDVSDGIRILNKDQKLGCFPNENGWNRFGIMGGSTVPSSSPYCRKYSFEISNILSKCRAKDGIIGGDCNLENRRVDGSARVYFHELSELRES